MANHRVSFRHAFRGIWYALTTQPNFKIHLLTAILVTIIGVIFKLARFEWLILLFTFSLVLIAEMINTALETMTDLIEEKHHLKAKIAKDVSAGMVFLSVLAAIIIGLTIFIPKVIKI